MMTYEEFMNKKMDIEAQMRKLKFDEGEARESLMRRYTDAFDELREEMKKRREQLFIERSHDLLLLQEEFKTRRTELWTKDTKLVLQWRSQLNEKGGES
jgi:hypothetical protein